MYEHEMQADAIVPVQPDPLMLAQALGVTLFQMPWHQPAYLVGQIGPWRIVHGGVGLDRGYYSGTCLSVGSPALLRRNAAGGWDTWMSMSPYEVESQELACRYAYGHTVVMGLGMGWVAANIALNPAVTKVTVVERERVRCLMVCQARRRARLNWCKQMPLPGYQRSQM